MKKLFAVLLAVVMLAAVAFAANGVAKAAAPAEEPAPQTQEPAAPAPAPQAEDGVVVPDPAGPPATIEPVTPAAPAEPEEEPTETPEPPAGDNAETGGGTTIPTEPAPETPEDSPRWQANVKPSDSIKIDAVGGVTGSGGAKVWASNSSGTIEIEN